MTKTLTLLFTSVALSVGLSLPSWSAMQSAGAPSLAQPVPAVLGQTADGAKLILVDDDDEDEGEGSAMKRDGDHEDEDDDGCEEDEGSCGSASNPAPAGTVAPPQNGLFGNGTTPKAQVN